MSGLLLPDNMIMRIYAFWFILLQFLILTRVYGEEQYQEVVVADPYLEMHTGPGSGYPIFYVVERGESITILRSHTSWYKIRYSADKIGWVDRAQLAQTLSPSGEQVELKEISRTEFEQRHWEIGAMGGSFGGAALLSLYGGYAFTPNFSVELSLSQAIGNISSNLIGKGSLLMSPFPGWRLSPYFSIGTGVLEKRPSTTIVSPRNTTNQFSTIGIGIRTHITERFIFRAEYNDYVIYSADNDNDDNEELGEWKLGFAVFF